MHRYRTHNCGELNLGDVYKEVKLSGWLSCIRDHGGVMFIDLRDHFGITQVVVSEKNELMDIIATVNKETTLSIIGTVTKRADDTVNKNLPTGEIELVAKQIEILGKAYNQLPFEIEKSNEAREELRLKYRFLDLRNEKIHNNIILRSKIIQAMRNKMTELGFLEIQTPILTSSSPEGARDFLVPSRLNPGKFYALPQAPQQFKQLLMMSGFDKYFQIAPCFRDEDARADRSPGEFYQLDLEMSFATQEDVFDVVEKVMYELFSDFTDWKIDNNFEKITYKDAMLKYGTDKPDLRNPLLIYDATPIFKDLDINVFKNKTVRVIPLANGGENSKSFFENMQSFAMENGAKGLAWVKINEDMSISGPIAKFVSEESKNKLLSLTNSKSGDVIFFVADKEDVANRLSGLVRSELGIRLNLLCEKTYKFCWIVDFPMYELNPDTKKIEFSHNPFSMPQGGLSALCEKDPLDILAYQYDLVCNGIELSSGAVRNHNPEIMVKAFDIAGYTKDDIANKFPALFNAFHYGAPPHAGIAPGVDRIVMLISNEANIREVIAFPMNSKAQDLLMGAPSVVTQKQLREIHIKVKE